MDWAGASPSPMTMTSRWSNVFRASDQWDVVDKLRSLSGNQYRYKYQTDARAHQVWRRDVSGQLQKSGRMGTRAIHMRYLAVKLRSLLQADQHAGSPGRLEDAFRNLPNLLERQKASAASTPPSAPKSGFDSFPPSTKRMILLVSERDSEGGVLARPVPSFVDILALSNVA